MLVIIGLVVCAVRAWKRTALLVWVGAVGVASLIVLLVAIGESSSSVRATGIALGSWFPVAITLLAALIAIRQPDNRIAWLLFGIGFAVLVEYFVQLSLIEQPAAPSWRELGAIVLAHVALPGAFYLLFLIAFVFPSGQFSSRRQAWAAWPGVIALTAVLLSASFTVEIGPPYPSEELAWTVVNPVGFIPVSVLDAAIASTLVVLVSMAVLGFVSLVMRYRHSSVVTRAQIRWMLFSTLIVGVILALITMTNASQKVVGGLLLQVAFLSVPASITVAITRYRLFDIDRIISRTVSYAVIVALLGSLFATGVVLLPTALGLEDSPLLVAAVTLLVAGLFNPLRRRVHEAVDRRFNRAHIEARSIEEQFAARLRSTHSTEELADLWRETVDESFTPQVSGLWLRSSNVHADRT